MADTVKLKRSAVAGKVPTTTDLDLGELGVNTYDGKIYLKQDNGTPTIKEVGAVNSVNGYTGTVVLGKADVGLGNVDDTSDLSKPVSTATQTALNLKADLASPALTGTPTAPTATAGTNTTQIATTAFVANAVSTADEWTRTSTTLAPKTAGDVVSVSAGTAALPGLTPVGDPNTGLSAPAADTLALSTNGNERLRIDNFGRLLVGTSSSINGPVPGYSSGALYNPGIHGVGNSYQSPAWLALSQFSTNTTASGGAFISLRKSNSATTGSYVAVNSGQRLGAIGFDGSNNTNFVNAAIIAAEVDGTPGAGDMPGRLVFSTTAAGANAPTERMRITSAGNVGIGTTSPANPLSVVGYGNATSGWSVGAEDGGTSGYLVSVGSTSNSIQIAADPSDVGANSFMQFSVDGSERARIDSSGRLLVGTSSSPTVGSAAQYARTVVQGNTFSTTGAGILNIQNASAPASTGSDIGFITFGANNGSEFAWIRCILDGTAGSGDYPGALVFSTTADGASSPTERMRIASDGLHSSYSNAVVTVWSSNYSASASNTIFIGRYGATAVNGGTDCICIRSNGNIQNTNNSYGAISDIKLKENVVDASSQWDDLKALQVRNYNFKEGQTHTQIGLIAQEVELVSPGLVSESHDRDAEGNDLGTVTKSVNYSVLYMKAVKALQEAMERIETLEAKVAALEGA